MNVDSSQIAFIFTSGAVAFLSPCGYPLLPGYITYYLGLKNQLSGHRAVLGGLACTLGLMTIFVGFGVVVATLGSIVYPYIPFFELLAGSLVLLLGILFLVNVRFNIPVFSVKATRVQGILGLYSYGLIYGLATLSCTFPIFLSMVLFSISSGGIIDGVLVFIIYTVGMAIPLLITSILVYKGKKYAVQKIIRFTRWSRILGGTVLIASGIYLILYYIHV